MQCEGHAKVRALIAVIVEAPLLNFSSQGTWRLDYDFNDGVQHNRMQNPGFEVYLHFLVSRMCSN